jgi:hypothetical protein
MVPEVVEDTMVLNCTRFSALSFLALGSLLLGACASSGAGTAVAKDKDGVKTLPTPDKVVMLGVGTPDGTKNELVVPDGDMATVKIDDDHVFGFTPRVAGSDAVDITVSALQTGEKPSWKEVEKVKVKEAAPASTKSTDPVFAIQLQGIKKAGSAQ